MPYNLRRAAAKKTKLAVPAFAAVLPAKRKICRPCLRRRGPRQKKMHAVRVSVAVLPTKKIAVRASAAVLPPPPCVPAIAAVFPAKRRKCRPCEVVKTIPLSRGAHEWVSAIRYE